MRRWLAVGLLACCVDAGAQGGFPWEDLKGLYRQALEREVREELTPEAEAPRVLPISRAEYVLSVEGGTVQGEARLSGSVQGTLRPRPAVLFSSEVILSSIDAVEGGSLVPAEGGKGTVFVLGEAAQNFSVAVHFYLQSQQEGGERILRFPLPPALQNVLTLHLPEGARLLEHPGLDLGQGNIVFAPTNEVVLRYAEATESTQAAAGQAPAVLEALSLFTSFDDSGKVLSTLVLDLPKQSGESLALKPVAEATIWSLRVNGQARQVYNDEQGNWRIPLTPEDVSHVELAFLRQGEKLGLQGELKVVVPETGLASQQLRVGVALPERVELLLADGPLAPADGSAWQMPKELVGRPYFFSQSFHQGEGATLTISYKEPVNQSAQQPGGAS